MDYKEFRERIEKYVIIPTDKHKASLIAGKNTIHFAIVLNNENEARMSESMRSLLDAIWIVEERGALFAKDFIVTASPSGHGLQIVLHSMDDFLSDEDFNKEYKRYNTK